MKHTQTHTFPKAGSVKGNVRNKGLVKNGTNSNISVNV